MKKILLSLITTSALIATSCYSVYFGEAHPSCTKDGLPCCAEFEPGKFYTMQVCPGDALCGMGTKAGHCAKSVCQRTCTKPQSSETNEPTPSPEDL